MARLDNEFTKACIILDNKNEVYFAGQIVSGKLEFELKSTIIVNSIRVTFLGEALVSWTEYDNETYNGQSSGCSVSYEGREEYFNFVQYLVGGIQGPSISLHRGKYSYPFQYQTPHICPSSFEGCRGKVWYRVLVNWEGPGAIVVSDLSFFKVFQLIAPLDLNNDADALRPINLELEDVYSCCFCDSGSLTLQVKVPYSGYCPGQVVPIEVVANNRSNVEVHQLLFTLRKRVAYHSQRPQSDYELPDEVISKSKKSVVPAHTKRLFTVDLNVPKMIAPNLDTCGIIDLGYALKVEIEVSGCNDGLQDEADFVIGLVPIADSHHGYVHPMRHCLPAEGAVSLAPAPAPAPMCAPHPAYPYPGSDDTVERPPPYSPMPMPMPLHGYPPPSNLSITNPTPSAPASAAAPLW